MEEQQEFLSLSDCQKELHDVIYATIGFLNIHHMVEDYSKIDIYAHRKLIALLQKQLAQHSKNIP